MNDKGVRVIKKRYLVSDYWPEFVSKRVNKTYEKSKLDRHCRLSAKAFLGASIILFLFALADVFLYTRLEFFFTNILSKAVVAFSGIIAYVWLMKHRTEKVLQWSQLVGGSLLILTVTLGLVGYIKYSALPPNIFISVFPYITLALMFYIYTPILLMNQLILGGVIFVAYIALVAHYFSFSDVLFIYSIAYLITAQTFGVIVSVNTNKLIRIVWAKQQQAMIKNRQLEKELQHRIKIEEQLRIQATTDPLTGLKNRRVFFEILQREFSNAKRHGRNLCVMLLDVDHFKSINDNYGHNVGDLVLVNLAKTLMVNLREGDLLARIGGEEFAIILTDMDLNNGKLLAEKLRVAINEMETYTEGTKIQTTASFGLSQLSSLTESILEFVKLADYAMYQAKENGRNRVEVLVKTADEKV